LLQERVRLGQLTSSAESLIPGAQGPYLILDPDLKVVRASNEYVMATLLWRQEIQGRRIFDILPDNAQTRAADGVRNMNASFQEVLRNRRPHRMREQRYDVRDYVGNGAWVEKYWLATNTPVTAGDSREVCHILHEVEDVTEAVRLRRWLKEKLMVFEEQRAALEQMLQDLNQDQRIFTAGLERLQEPAFAGEEAVQELKSHLRAPETRLYFRPGQLAPVGGIYEVFHFQKCNLAPSTIYNAAGKPFPPCPVCQANTYYRLLRRL
jgi:hypothetical protein